MSNRVKAILIVLAGLVLVGIGVFASVFLIQRLQVEARLNEQAAETVKMDVVVVTRDLLLGDELAANDLKLTTIPVEVAPRNVITSLDQAVGKIIKNDLTQGEILLASNLADPTNNNRDLSFILADGHVLLAFPANDLMSRENMIQRGDIVDIFATFEEPVQTVPETTTDTTAASAEQNEPQMRTFTVNAFQKVSVTAIVMEIITEDGGRAPLQTEETQPARESTSISSYLLALDPQDALILKHLKDTEAIFDIVLRSPTSTIQFNLTPVTEEYIVELYGLEILP